MEEEEVPVMWRRRSFQKCGGGGGSSNVEEEEVPEMWTQSVVYPHCQSTHTGGQFSISGEDMNQARCLVWGGRNPKKPATQFFFAYNI